MIARDATGNDADSRHGVGNPTTGSGGHRRRSGLRKRPASRASANLTDGSGSADEWTRAGGERGGGSGRRVCVGYWRSASDCSQSRAREPERRRRSPCAEDLAPCVAAGRVALERRNKTNQEARPRRCGSQRSASKDQCASGTDSRLPRWRLSARRRRCDCGARGSRSRRRWRHRCG